MDQLDIIRPVNFTAQAFHRDIDHVGIAIEIHIPYLRSNHGARKYLALAAHQQMQQHKFFICQRDDGFLTSNLASENVEMQVGQRVGIGLSHRPAPQQGTHAQHQLGK